MTCIFRAMVLSFLEPDAIHESTISTFSASNALEKQMFPLRRTPYCPMTLRSWHWVSIKPCKSAFGFEMILSLPAVVAFLFSLLLYLPHFLLLPHGLPNRPVLQLPLQQIYHITLAEQHHHRGVFITVRNVQ